MSLTSIKVDFKTSSDRTTYILFSVGKKLICAMVNGRLSMYIEENGVMGHVSVHSGLPVITSNLEIALYIVDTI